MPKHFEKDRECAKKKPPAISAKASRVPHPAGMELLKLMMFKTDFLSNGKCDDRVPPINLSQLPEFLLCKLPTPAPSNPLIS